MRTTAAAQRDADLLDEVPSVASRLATWFGCGQARMAPGTVGSLGAIPLRYAISILPAPVQFAVTGAVAVAGFWAANEVAKTLDQQDPDCVVIDEVAGTLIALGLVAGRSLQARALAFGLFRLFDVWKPGVINRVQQARPAGLGIMADDLLAGVLAGALARWLTRSPQTRQ